MHVSTRWRALKIPTNYLGPGQLSQGLRGRGLSLSSPGQGVAVPGFRICEPHWGSYGELSLGPAAHVIMLSRSASRLPPTAPALVIDCLRYDSQSVVV